MNWELLNPKTDKKLRDLASQDGLSSEKEVVYLLPRVPYYNGGFHLAGDWLKVIILHGFFRKAAFFFFFLNDHWRHLQE